MKRSCVNLFFIILANLRCYILDFFVGREEEREKRERRGKKRGAREGRWRDRVRTARKLEKQRGGAERVHSFPASLYFPCHSIPYQLAFQF